MKKQLRVFFTALMFFTRLPVPSRTDHSEDYLNKSVIYFPLIGWIVGGFSALAYWLFHFILPVELAVLLSMAVSIYITGAFHEDGWADTCDGFGGGWSKNQILDIMKDSRVGAFGMIGTVLILGAKFLGVSQMPPTLIVPALVVGHSLSRFMGVVVVFTTKYSRENEDSKAKPLAKQINKWQFTVAAVFGLVPLAFFPNLLLLFGLIPLLLVTWWMRRLFVHKIGGYTGDGLGAVQQLTEVVVYLIILMIPRISALWSLYW